MISETLTFGRVGSRPYGQLTIAEISTFPELNQSLISIQLVLKRPSNIQSTATKTATCTINGQTYDWVGTIGGRGDKVLISKTQAIPHDDDGSKTIFVSASITLEVNWGGIWLGSIQGSDAITLTKIERATPVTQTLAGRTETSLIINWSTTEPISGLWVSSNNGSTWSEIPVFGWKVGSYGLRNLTAGTEYNVKTKVRQKSDGVISESSTLTVSTYSYPYATSMPNFSIGDPVTIEVFNPLGHTITVEMLDVNDSTVKSYEISNTTLTGFSDNSSQDNLYMSIPNSQTGTYKIKVTYDGHVSTLSGGTYQVKYSECAPEFGSVSYQDVNSSTVAITQDPQKIVQVHSTVRYTASGLSAKNHATIASCIVSVNGRQYNLSLSGDTATGGNLPIDSGTSVIATFALTDSRGLTYREFRTVTILPYTAPTAVIKIARQSNFYTAVNVKVNAKFSSINGHNEITITYKAKKVSESQYTVTGTLQDSVQSTIQLDNQYAWDVEIVLEDSLHINRTYSGFKVGVGIPLFFIDRKKSSLGINCFPKESKSLELNGIKITPDGAMTSTLGATLTNLQTNTFTSISLNNYTTTNRSIFDSFLVPGVTEGIMVMQPLSYILVSGSVSFSKSSASGERGIRVMCVHNGHTNYFSEVRRFSAVSGRDTLSIPPFVLQLDSSASYARVYLQYTAPSSLDSIETSATWLTAQTT